MSLNNKQNQARKKIQNVFETALTLDVPNYTKAVMQDGAIKNNAIYCQEILSRGEATQVILRNYNELTHISDLVICLHFHKRLECPHTDEDLPYFNESHLDKYNDFQYDVYIKWFEVVRLMFGFPFPIVSYKDWDIVD